MVKLCPTGFPDDADDDKDEGEDDPECCRLWYLLIFLSDLRQIPDHSYFQLTLQLRF